MTENGNARWMDEDHGHARQKLEKRDADQVGDQFDAGRRILDHRDGGAPGARGFQFAAKEYKGAFEELIAGGSGGYVEKIKTFALGSSRGPHLPPSWPFHRS